MLSALVCLGCHTVTGLLHTAGDSCYDWPAVYRLFSQARAEAQDLFGVVRRGVLEQLPPAARLVVALDDSLLPKRAPKLPAPPSGAIRWGRPSRPI